MALDAGTTTGPYEVTGLIVQGCMGDYPSCTEISFDTPGSSIVTP